MVSPTKSEIRKAQATLTAASKAADKAARLKADNLAKKAAAKAAAEDIKKAKALLKKHGGKK